MIPAIFGAAFNIVEIDDPLITVPIALMNPNAS